MSRSLSALRLSLVVSSLALLAAPAQCQTESVLYSFTGGADGAEPYTPVILDAQGNLYGTTDQAAHEGGVVFTVTPSGQETVLYTLCSKNRCVDGAYPSGLVFGPMGNLYGTTRFGGDYDGGVVFQVSPENNETVLHSFSHFPPPSVVRRGRLLMDGSVPGGRVVFDALGNLFGTTGYGGTYGHGTVYEVTSSGVETVLYSFAGGTDGADPDGALTLDATGNLYGTTYSGELHGVGTLFKLTANGTKTTLYDFCSQSGCTDGAYPLSAVMDSQGNFYGTTYLGGAPCNDDNYTCGVVFELVASGSEIVLHSFVGGDDGAYPNGDLVRDNAGNLYGTTFSGGLGGQYCSSSCGTVFKVTASGTETVLYKFKGYPNDGENPLAGVAIDPEGNLYGTTEDGGAYDWGTVFKLTP